MSEKEVFVVLVILILPKVVSAMAFDDIIAVRALFIYILAATIFDAVAIDVTDGQLMKTDEAVETEQVTAEPKDV